MTHSRRSRFTRIGISALLAAPLAVGLVATRGAQAALNGLTPFEIDANTVPTAPTNLDWTNKDNVTVENDMNYIGAAVVPTNVGSASTVPPFVDDCPNALDTRFDPGTKIDDPNWTDDTGTGQQVNQKSDLCQSFFAFDVVPAGDPDAGHIIAYIGVTRSDINGDASYFFVLSHGPNPDIRVDGDIVIEIDYTGQGQPNDLGFYEWSGSPTPTLGNYVAVLDNGAPVPTAPQLAANFDVSPVEYFGEMAIDLTALGLAPNAFDISSPEDCEAFGFGRAISRTGNGKTATLKDDGEPARIDVELCGSVQLTKVVDPPTATGWEFGFTISPSAGLAPGATQTVTSAAPTVSWSNLVDGVEYTITETDVAPGYQMGSITCDGGDNTFTAVAGEVIACTATNTQSAQLTVVKSAAPAADDLFEFSTTNVDPSTFTLSDPSASSTTYTDLVPGQTHTIAETLTEDQMAAGWKAVSVACIDALDSSVVQGTVTETGGSVEVTSQPGSNITCTFSNAQGSSITIQKGADPVGTANVFPFTVTGPEGAPLPPMPIVLDVNSDPTHPAIATISQLPPGEYTVSEATPSGWALTQFECLSDGEPIGTPDPGTGSVTFTVTEGQDIVCNYFNTQLGTISVSKVTDPAGDSTQFDFTTTGLPEPGFSLGDGQTIEILDLPPGAYSVAETDEPGWQLTDLVCLSSIGTEVPVDVSTGVASIELDAGENVDCTYTNTKLGSITVDKVTDPAGDPTAFPFTATNLTPATFAVTDAGAPQTFTGLLPGSYSVTEVVPAGWQLVDLACVVEATPTGQVSGSTTQLTLDAGQDVVCTYVNEKLATVSVTKTVAGSTAGWSFDFTISPNPLIEGQATTQTATAANPVVTWVGLDPGVAYTIEESTEAGFVNGAVDCDGDATFTPAPGEAVTCAVTNSALASVDVTKTVAGDSPTWSFDFTITPVPAGETATKSATNAAPTVGWDGLAPGTPYKITETDQAGFITGTLTCAGGTNGVGTSTFTPAAGQAVACSITNDVVEQQAPPIADIAVVKTATPSVVTPGGNVTWTLVATNNGPDAADNVTIVDNLPATLTLVSFTSPAGWDCSATVTGNPGKLSCAKPTMGLNESATFTLTTTVAAAAAGTTINNTAVVSTSTGETTTSNNQDSEPITVQVAVLPPTGASHVWNRLAIAASLVLAGGLLLAIDRRRRITS